MGVADFRRGGDGLNILSVDVGSTVLPIGAMETRRRRGDDTAPSTTVSTTTPSLLISSARLSTPTKSSTTRTTPERSPLSSPRVTRLSTNQRRRNWMATPPFSTPIPLMILLLAIGGCRFVVGEEKAVVGFLSAKDKTESRNSTSSSSSSSSSEADKCFQKYECKKSVGDDHTICISESQLCNGRRDCKYQDDEIKTICADFRRAHFPANEFSRINGGRARNSDDSIWSARAAGIAAGLISLFVVVLVGYGMHLRMKKRQETTEESPEPGPDVEAFVEDVRGDEEAWRIANNTGVPPSLQKQESARHLVSLHQKHHGASFDDG